MRNINSLLTEDFYIKVGGRRLRVRKLKHSASDNPNPRPILVFLHEALGSVEQWHDFPATLAKITGCDALIYDRWGHGKSDTFEGQRTIRYIHDEALESLPEVLENSNVRDAILVGHSDGASIAFVFAAEYQETVRGIIVEGAHVFVEEMILESIREAIESYETTNFKEKLSRYHGDNTEKIFRAWCNIWLSPEFKKWNIEKCLSKINCPVLVIHGKDDHYGSEDQVGAIASQVAGPATSLIIPNCAHIPHKEAKDRVVREMTGFIRTLRDKTMHFEGGIAEQSAFGKLGLWGRS
jgi:pimeloyl-ACP methyl ester carboxylesterase